MIQQYALSLFPFLLPTISGSFFPGSTWFFAFFHHLQCAMMTRTGVMATDAPREMAGSIIWSLGQSDGKIAAGNYMKRLKTELRTHP